MNIYNLGRFEILLTDSKSVYLLGLLWADGYLGKSGGKAYSVCLRLQDSDFQCVEHLMTPEWGNWKIFDYKRPENQSTWKKMRQGMINSRELCLFLENFEFHLKSVRGPKLILETIPANLRHYFLRGYSDGDGCFYFRKSKWGATYSIAGSYNFEWNFLNYFPVHFKIRQTKFKTGTSSTVTLNTRQDIICCGDFIYSGEIFGLERKYQKFLEIKVDHENKILPKYHIEVVSPEGLSYIVTNAYHFSKTHGLNYGGLCKLIKKKSLSCQGWRLKETSFEDFINRKSRGGKEYFLLFNGEIVKIKNLSRFCRDNHLSRNSLKALVAGKIRKHKGYTLYDA